MSDSKSDSNSGTTAGGEVSSDNSSAGQQSQDQTPFDADRPSANVSSIADGSRSTGKRSMPARNDSDMQNPPDFEHSEIGVVDWNMLFGAVEERLQRAVSNASAAGSLLDAEARATHIRAVVVDCVAALDKLHMALHLERSQRATPDDEKLQADLAAAQRLTAAMMDDLK